MKEHLLAIVFLGLLFLLYMAPMPESFLNIDFEQTEQVDEQINSNPVQNPAQPKTTNQQDSIRTSVVAATRL